MDGVMKVTPEDIIKNIDQALQEAWRFVSIPDIVFVNSELAEIMISSGCKSKKKRQRKKWAKKYGFRRMKPEEYE
jgi:hypothetical protein